MTHTMPAEEIDALVSALSLETLTTVAEQMTLGAHGPRVTYSRKVFLPLTKLCRDVCHYCTFATTPSKIEEAFLSIDRMVQIARAGEALGCREALFTLGDRPEARYAAARTALAALGHETTLGYLAQAAQAVMAETGLLPHFNAGLMDRQDYDALRPYSASMGLMLETAAERLSEKGGPHHGSPDKLPSRRLASIEAAGEARVPFTTGLLIGIGETRRERIDALVAIRDIHARHGHIQEVIIQNFQPKPGTRMADHPAAPLEEHLWTIAVARLVLGEAMTIQAPPNLHRPQDLPLLLRAGVNDWGGVSPLTPDHVNPEAPWPHLDKLADTTAQAGRDLRQRLAIGPSFALEARTWCDAGIATPVLRAIDARGLPKTDSWEAGQGALPPERELAVGRRPGLQPLIEKASFGDRLDEREVAALFEAEGEDFDAIVAEADRLRRLAVGDDITFVVNRNINYTNICLYKCGFCAFSKGSSKSVRGPAYQLDLEEVGRRSAEAWERGATEVCLQGGIHPSYDGNTYLEILGAVRAAAPGLHIHAFSPLEITHGAQTLGLELDDYLARLKAAGLSTLPGTAAEILDEDIRDIICPDKISTTQWLQVMRSAHSVGLRSTATIMFGHVERYIHWARHLLHVRDLQEVTGGFTEFVPLPFVHMEAPLWRKGLARSGPSFREALLMHAIARLVLHPLITNIQTSWVKMGPEGAVAALRAGANDLGGVLMDESITRAAGGKNGQNCSPDHMHEIARMAGRTAAQRTTLYGRVRPEFSPVLHGAS